ncbi:MAG: copper chaperone PCu(A)C [Nitrospinae bacterium]|nr:copper chaperone PCu(A)C [Nitrospinota bacterium]
MATLINRIALLFLFVAVGFTSTVHAKEVAAKSIKVHKPVVYATLPGTTTAPVYMELKNVGSENVTVTRVNSTVSVKAEIHGHIHSGGMMKMNYQPKLEIRKGSSVVMEPGGYHIMLIGLNKKLVAGEQVELSFTFSDGSSLTVFAPITDMKKAMQLKQNGMKMDMHSGH